jgi:hypothetical protein
MRPWRLDLMHQRLSLLILEEPELLEGPDDRASELRHDAELSLKRASIVSDLTPTASVTGSLRTARGVASQ